MVEIWAIPILNGHCAGTHCSVQPENSVLHVQGSLNLTFASTFACKGAQSPDLHTRANSGKFSATRATWSVWYTNSMMQLVVARGLSGCDMGNTNLKSALCGHALFSST